LIPGIQTVSAEVIFILSGVITVPFVLVLFASFVKDSGLWTKGTTLGTKGTKILDKLGTNETRIRQA
jgi:hypothetical protein